MCTVRTQHTLSADMFTLLGLYSFFKALATLKLYRVKLYKGHYIALMMGESFSFFPFILFQHRQLMGKETVRIHNVD